ncbi:hypothetical protein K6119_04110 [Paracrocinitomix mangrovi]|uniref:hypothetical protein n=1 Tax=Paracrocinitomix mangrovi TaxID=2862509 RepID=UPI001C8E8C27|nr:hypothetical protein [Paracrocinitomix mangrovi]UKN02697.1 hypothetical protein K6119_04110 [Paracrocinitomix mangrovi]
MKNYILILTVVFRLTSCVSDSDNSEGNSNDSKKQAQKEFFDNVFNDDQIETQVYTIDGNSDTTLICKNGSKLRIYKESLILNGEDYEGEIEIHFKEALEPIDFVMGNLTTVSNIGNLQSGGMVFFEAYAGDQILHINTDAPVGVIVPCEQVDEAMTTWHGNRNDDSVMEWSQDERMLNNDVEDLNLAWTRVLYWHHNYDEDEYSELEKTYGDSINNFFWDVNSVEGNKLEIEGCVIEIMRKETKLDSVELEDWAGGIFLSELMNVGNVNEFKEDPNTSYLFTLNDIGWANIDRLFTDPRSEKVELFTSVENEENYDFVYSTLMLKNESMYLPGYQMEDNTFGFTHYDTEKPILPIGAEAIVLCTAYKDGVPHYDYKKFDIQKEQKINLKLKPSEMDAMKSQLKELMES